MNLRVCHIQTRLLNGGADENTVITCNHQALNGHKVTLIHGKEVHEEMISKVDPLVQKILVPSLCREINPIRDWIALSALKKELASINPQIVHTHTSKAGILGRMAARGCKDAKIVHGVHILPFLNVGWLQKRLFIALERHVARHTENFICVSEGLQEENIAHRIAPREKHIVVPSGMDIERFAKADPIDYKCILPLDKSRIRKPRIIVYVGALEKRKRQVEVLDVMKRVHSCLPDTVLLFVGDGIERQRIEKAIKVKGMKDCAFLLGFREDVENIISLADVCLLASEREGLARVLIQYALAGKPIISTALPGVETVVREGKNGHLVPINNLHAMQEPLIELLRNPSKREAFGKASSHMDFSRWSVINMVSEIEKVYRGII